jgi:hypothetical protein
MVQHPKGHPQIMSPYRNIRVKVLRDDEIHLAQRLCYEVFVLEQSWMIHPNNPTQLRVESGKLCDPYDQVATWLGVFADDNLIACNRFCTRLENTFELEHYHPLPPFIQQDDFAVEATRLAVGKEFRSSSVILELVRFEFKDLLQQGFKTLFTTGFWPKPGGFYMRRFGLKKHGDPFRYHPEDPNPVYLFYIKRPELENTIKRLDSILG